jgi:hypothetical protein
MVRIKDGTPVKFVARPDLARLVFDHASIGSG